MEIAIRLTGSTIGYMAFVNDDETVLTMHYWSNSAMQQCAMIDKPIVYPVAIRQLNQIIAADQDLWCMLAYPVRAFLFMRTIRVGVEEAHRNGLYIFFFAAANMRGQVREIEIFEHLPISVQTLVHFEAEFARDKRGWLGISEVVNVGPVRALYFEHIAKAAGSE